jgi:hypothetical protein
MKGQQAFGRAREEGEKGDAAPCTRAAQRSDRRTCRTSSSSKASCGSRTRQIAIRYQKERVSRRARCGEEGKAKGRAYVVNRPDLRLLASLATRTSLAGGVSRGAGRGFLHRRRRERRKGERSRQRQGLGSDRHGRVAMKKLTYLRDREGRA